MDAITVAMNLDIRCKINVIHLPISGIGILSNYYGMKRKFCCE